MKAGQPSGNRQTSAFRTSQVAVVGEMKSLLAGFHTSTAGTGGAGSRSAGGGRARGRSERRAKSRHQRVAQASRRPRMRCELSVGRTRHRPWTEPGGAAVGCRRRTPPSPLVGNADTYVLNVFILVLGILRFMYARSTVAERFPNVL